jgi:ribonuclease D
LLPATYIDSDDALLELLSNLKGETILAVDTESNNMYAYEGRICLIQLSTHDADYIIDPLTIENMNPFGDLLADSNIEKIFHAAEYDLLCLKREFGFEVQNLFDTMCAARFCGVQHFGLADLLLGYFDIEVDKSHQQDDWGKRPLPQDSLQYAQMDTHYLHDLRDLLRGKLKELDCLEEAYEVFADALYIEAKDQAFDPDGFWKLGRPRSLTRRQLAILRELYILRDAIAREKDRPHFKVISNTALITLARKQPRNHKTLYDIKGLGEYMIHYHGDDIISAIQKGRSNQLPSPPPHNGPTSDVAERYTILHAWRRDRAEERGIDSSLIISKHTLWQLAHMMPKNKEALTAIEGIGAWRLKTYADEILEIIKTMR